MRSLVVYGAKPSPLPLSVALKGQPVEIDQIPLRCGVVEASQPRFDARKPEFSHSVLVRVRGFSCNYRDKGFAFMMQQFAQTRFCPIGSEFIGEVVDVGAAVARFRKGDRVLPNHHYTGALPGDGPSEGVATNQSSREFIVLHEAKLLPAPSQMPDEVGASFTLNAQTAYSMVRRAGVTAEDRVLVTSARSNTSLFLIHAVKAIGATVYATTSSEASADQVRRLGGIEQVVAVGRGEGFSQNEELVRIFKDDGMFSVVLDPMYDVHLERSAQLLAPFGRYVSCGMLAQNPNSRAASGLTRGPNCSKIMESVLQKNLSIIGNCVGTTHDLNRALTDYADGRLEVTVDSTFEGESAAPFLDRTFNSRERFGKVSFLYTTA
ncbi:MAG: zinc-binding alcohol dehydrogenase family protein [Bacteroidota bacterium]